MAGSSSHLSLSPTSKRENGGSSLPGIMSPTSPGSSDVGSIASGVPARSKSQNMPSRLGNLHGAGLSSLQLALGEASASSGSKSGLTGFNAISTLLNDPKRPQRPIDPSSSRYPAISQSHTDLPKVKRSDFEGYITSTKKEWERFQRNLQLGSRGKARLEADDVESDSKRQSIDRTQGSDPPEVDHTAIIGSKKLPPLSTVPQVFFAEDFDLGNPYTFDLVTERYKAAGGTGSARNGSAAPSNGYDVALNQMLQEKLSYYSDVVEQHLILEISARSTSFFAALGNLQDLESEAAHCLKRVESLKGELEDKEENIAKAGLRVIREQAKRREMVERLEAVGILQLLCEKKDLCRLLVQSGEWSEALDVMDLLQNVIEGREKLQRATSADSSLPPHVDLDFASIASVKAFLPQLDEMKEAISIQLQSDLMTLLSQDLQRQVGEPEQMEVPPMTAAPIDLETDADKFINPSTPIPGTPNLSDVTSISPSSQDLTLQERISAHLHGLIRAQGVDRAVNTYREMALQATRSTFRNFLCQSEVLQADGSREDLATLLEDDEAASGKADVRMGPGGAEAATRLREMSHEHFLSLVRFMLMGLSRSIHGVVVQTRVILRVLAEAGKAEVEDGSTMGVMMPLGVSPSLPATLSSTVSDVGGLTHVLSSRLLSLRSSSHVSLPLSDFLAVFHLCWSFILKSESTCNRMIIGLRGVVLNQAKSWLANFHRIRIERAARAVEEEKWSQADTNASQQKFIELVVDSATADPSSLVVKVTPGPGTSNDEQEAFTEKPTSKTLMIEDRPYFVVGATLDVLEMLVEYLKVVINLPLLSTETMGRVVEFAKQFNSRTCQVVLGAGAMRSAGLSNITAKHLALASQSLSVMITLIPYVRETVRRHLSPKQAVMLIEFDKLKRDYQEHQYEIHSKLVAIMSDRLTVHCRAMTNVQWNTDGEATEPIKPASDLAKETTTLHKVLCRYLQSSVVENVIGQVLTAIDKRISAEFRKVDVKEEAALQRMNVAKSFFDEKFNALKYVEWSAKELEEAIEEQKAALDKSKAASAPLPEKKEAVPAYKPRINLFGRRNTATPGTPPSARASFDVVAEKNDEAAPAPVVKSEAEVEMATVTEGEVEIISTDDTSNKPIVPAKDTLDEKSPSSDQGVNSEDQPPSPPHKEEVQADNKTTIPILTVDSTSSDTQILTAPATPLLSSRPSTPAAPSAPATPVKGSQERFASPTPGRLTLQQRLAEAARKRAQGNASRRPPPSEATSSGIVTPARTDNEIVAETVVPPPESTAEAQSVNVEAAVEPVKQEEEVQPEPQAEAETEAKVETEVKSVAEVEAMPEAEVKAERPVREPKDIALHNDTKEAIVEEVHEGGIVEDTKGEMGETVETAKTDEADEETTQGAVEIEDDAEEPIAVDVEASPSHESSDKIVVETGVEKKRNEDVA